MFNQIILFLHGVGVLTLKKVITFVAAFLITGCSTLGMVKEYNQNIKDDTGTSRVGIAFDLKGTQTRIYPETESCINLYSSKNGFIPSGSDMWGDHKIIGVPYVDEMTQNRNEYWVSANKIIAIRILYVGKLNDNGFLSNRVNDSYVTFKPEPGAFYYANVEGSSRNRELKVYKIVKKPAGYNVLEPVQEAGIHNCPGQQPWYMQGGAVI